MDLIMDTLNSHFNRCAYCMERSIISCKNVMVRNVLKTIHVTCKPRDWILYICMHFFENPRILILVVITTLISSCDMYALTYCYFCTFFKYTKMQTSLINVTKAERIKLYNTVLTYKRIVILASSFNLASP